MTIQKYQLVCGLNHNHTRRERLVGWGSVCTLPINHRKKSTHI